MSIVIIYALSSIILSLIMVSVTVVLNSCLKNGSAARIQGIPNITLSEGHNFQTNNFSQEPASERTITTSSTKKQKKVPVIIGTIFIIAILGILLFKTLPKGFNAMYSDIADESWCYIAPDGNSMTIEIEPYMEDSELALSKVKEINSDLGFSQSVFQEMLEAEPSNAKTFTCGKYKLTCGLIFSTNYGQYIVHINYEIL